MNYRPISVLFGFSKIIENLMHTRLMSFLNSNNISHSSQHGFRSSHNVTTAILDELNYVVNMKANHLLLYYYSLIYLKLLIRYHI